jgi:dihydrofolate reductase
VVHEGKIIMHLKRVTPLAAKRRAEELIDELIISRIPIVLGDGIPLFGSLNQPQAFDLVKTETFENGMTRL